MERAASSKNKLKEKAILLRNQKRSYNEIKRELGIPKSTLSSWFKTDTQSIKVKNELIKKAQINVTEKLRKMALANKKKWELIHLNYRRQARKEFPSLADNPFFGPGLVIYWGEGDKRLSNSIVRISNTDHRILKIFASFLKFSCKVSPDKIRVWLLLYPDLVESKCKEYWSKELKIPAEQFTKAHFITGKEKQRKIRYGVCSIQVYSRELKEKIIEWIDLYSKKLENVDFAGMV